jgi:Protein of unknown function (DUF3253)
VVLSDTRLRAEILRSLEERAADSSSCPSEIARALAAQDSEWRSLMPRIRQVLTVLVSEQRVEVTRGSEVLAPDGFAGGPIRIRRGRLFGP